MSKALDKKVAAFYRMGCSLADELTADGQPRSLRLGQVVRFACERLLKDSAYIAARFRDTEGDLTGIKSPQDNAGRGSAEHEADSPASENEGRRRGLRREKE